MTQPTVIFFGPDGGRRGGRRHLKVFLRTLLYSTANRGSGYSKSATDGYNSILYFTVTDIAATHAAIVERGAKNERAPQLAAKMPDHELWTGFVRDPDGNLIGLMEEKH
jgi:hypothetical protein